MFRWGRQLVILVALVITLPLVSKWVLERSREFQSVEWTPLFENSVTYALASPGTQYAMAIVTIAGPDCDEVLLPPPLLELGTGVYSDDFEDSSSGWLTERGVNAEYSYRSGEYVIKVKRVNWVAWAWAPTDLVPTDFEAQVETRALSNVPGSYGIVWGDNDDFYLFEVTTEGRCGIYRSRGGQWQTIVSSRWNGAIRSGGTNLLLISVSGGTVKFRINGETAVTRSLARPSSSRVGLLAGTYSQTPFAAAFDDFEIREASALELPPLPTSSDTCLICAPTSELTCGETCGLCLATTDFTCGSTCDATCDSTCGATCGSTCDSTCGATCDYTCSGPTCFSTCEVTCGYTCGTNPTCSYTCEATCGYTCGTNPTCSYTCSGCW